MNSHRAMALRSWKPSTWYSVRPSRYSWYAKTSALTELIVFALRYPAARTTLRMSAQWVRFKTRTCALRSLSNW